MECSPSGGVWVVVTVVTYLGLNRVLNYGVLKQAGS